MDSSIWLVGDGENINCWIDNWCGEVLAHSLNLSYYQLQSLPKKLCNFVRSNQWNFPAAMFDTNPNLCSLVNQVTIPTVRRRDKLVWKHSNNGEITLKEAYCFKKSRAPKLPWAKIIWFVDFPPSNSLLVWRFMHGKLSTDENLDTRGCQLPSMCSLCCNALETSNHLFVECSYALHLWSWFASTVNRTVNVQTKEKIWNGTWNPQCKTVLTATIINILNAIRFARNQNRFQNKAIHWKSSISSIISNTALSGNHTKYVASASISNFVILKKFNVTLHSPRAPLIIEVIWQPPPPFWIKCNTDGSTNGNLSSCGGIFRDSKSDFLLCFGENAGIGNSLHAELSRAMRAIEIANSHQWFNLWLEADLELVIKAFKNVSLVRWKLRNRWLNCAQLISRMNFLATHIYREGNECADSLASLGFNVSHCTIWMNIPDSIRSYYVKNKLGLPNFRFKTF